MDKKKFEEYLSNRYEDQMKYYSKKSRENRDKYQKFQWTLIILSALTPVIAAWDDIPLKLDFIHLDASVHTKLIVVTISAIVAILTTGLKTFSYFELWVTYRKTNEELKREIYYYNFFVGPYGVAGVNRETLFVMSVETILDKEHVKWAPLRKLEEQLKNPPPDNPPADNPPPENPPAENPPVQEPENPETPPVTEPPPAPETPPVEDEGEDLPPPVEDPNENPEDKPK